ncbi:DUF4232 domain-containing protein [Streptacidiphilus sp. 4-A2]|nr:DUF4232 domain-containing protein [Streptacidiphilus sp. 4-A2]
MHRLRLPRPRPAERQALRAADPGGLGFDLLRRRPGRHTVTLKPGQSAWSDLAWHAPYGVKSVTPSYLEVTPPNETTHLTIGFAPGAIDDDTLHVTALAAHLPAE